MRSSLWEGKPTTASSYFQALPKPIQDSIMIQLKVGVFFLFRLFKKFTTDISLIFT